ncbi:MAG: type II toxin-antitoxin system HicA family toxin [Phycisphaeraceae bacterium]|nr:type II toxin-antitoxin system HicA family toxin [Phycisphaeraceae bacterium]
MKFREVVKLVVADGWYHDRTVGSHMIFRHPTKPGTVTIPGGGKLNRDVKQGTLTSILKQAGIKR